MDKEMGHDIHKLAEHARRIGEEFHRAQKLKASRNRRTA